MKKTLSRAARYAECTKSGPVLSPARFSSYQAFSFFPRP
jgi:hypothetical protein